MTTTPKPTRKTLILQAAASPELAAAVKAAADRDLMTISEFTRRALIERLRWSGFDPGAPAPINKEAAHAA